MKFGELNVGDKFIVPPEDKVLVNIDRSEEPAKWVLPDTSMFVYVKTGVSAAGESLLEHNSLCLCDGSECVFVDDRHVIEITI